MPEQYSAFWELTGGIYAPLFAEGLNEDYQLSCQKFFYKRFQISTFFIRLQNCIPDGGEIIFIL